MISFRPISSRIATKLLGFSLADSAELMLELSPPAIRSLPPAIMLPDDTLRIKRHHAYSAPALNNERLTASRMMQRSTRMYLLRDAIIADGTILSRSFFDRIAPERRRMLVRGEPEFVDEAVLCSTWFTQRYFGHWLREGLAFEQLAADQGLKAIVHDRDPWLHEASYRRLSEFDPPRVSFARCDRLWLVEDPRYNFHFAERYTKVRDRFRLNIGAPSEASARVFLCRGQLANGRALSNQDEVRRELARRGFVIVEPEQLDAAKLGRILSGARLVIGAEGSALAHAAIAMRAGAGLLAIMGAQHFNMNYKGVADAVGLHFGFTVADAVARERFSQPVDRLLRAIDLMEERIEHGGSDSNSAPQLAITPGVLRPLSKRYSRTPQPWAVRGSIPLSSMG